MSGKRLTLILPGLAVLLAGAGCGDTSKTKEDAAGRTVVRGSLVENGKPFMLDESKIPPPPGAIPGTRPPGESGGGGALQVTFISAEGKEEYEAKTNPEAGTFEVSGPDGSGIKPGRYKIAVVGSRAAGSAESDYFKGRFSPEKTKIVRDVKPGDDVVIDIAKPQG
jgi:hypothetical protein